MLQSCQSSLFDDLKESKIGPSHFNSYQSIFLLIFYAFFVTPRLALLAAETPQPTKRVDLTTIPTADENAAKKVIDGPLRFTKQDGHAMTPLQDLETASVAIEGPLNVTLDLDVLLQTDDPKKKEAILIDLSADKQVVIYVKRFQSRGSTDDFSWFGVNKEEDAKAVMSVKKGILAGTITLAHETFRIEYIDGYYQIIRLDPSSMVPFGDDAITPRELIPVPESALSKSPSTTSEQRALSRQVSDSGASDPTTVDMMLVYTQQFKEKYGAAAEANIQNIFDLAETAYSESLTEVDLRLVHIQQLPAGSTLNDTSDLRASLNTMRDDQDPFIRSARLEHGADAVSLIGTFEAVNSYCGLGNWPVTTSDNMLDAFTVVLYGIYYLDDYHYRYCHDNTFAHELGHNFGCTHDRSHHGSTDPMYTYAFGHDVVDDDPSSDSPEEFATIMSYDTPNIDYFSNPNIIHEPSGLPIGIPEGEENAADCARTIRENRGKIADNDSEIDESLETDDILAIVTNGYSIIGNLRKRSDRDSYTLTLGGETSFTIGRTPWYIAIELYDADQRQVFSSDGRDDSGNWIDPLTTTLPEGTYEMMIHAGNWIYDAWQYDIDITTAYQTGPSQTLNTGSTVTEGITDIITATELAFAATSSTSTEIIYTITADVSHGELRLNGNALSIGDTFTQDDLYNALLTYLYDGSDAHDDRFTFSVTDAAGSVSDGHAFDFTITWSDAHDRDGDGHPDSVDTFPQDPEEWVDTDGDTIGDNADPDDDGDGISDADELRYGLDPLNPDDAILDSDGDGVSNLDEINAGTDPKIGNIIRQAYKFDPMLILMLEKVNFEGDFDDDGHPNHDDAFPKDRTEWIDSDGDTIGDNADLDDDGDGISDADELRYGLDPLDSSDATDDRDGDGVSNLDEIKAGTDPRVADNTTVRPNMLSLPLIIDYVLRQREEANR